MDKFLIKAGKNQREKGGAWEGKETPWKEIRSEGLHCDYRILFGKKEADGILLELERDIEYLQEDLAKLYVFGKWHKAPRQQAAYGEPGLSYTYSGATFSPKPWVPILQHLRERVQEAIGHSFNFVLVNRYKDGRDRMGEHRDDERELEPRSPIASLSFGAERDFVFRHCSGGKGGRPAPGHPAPVWLRLGHGSLLVMHFPTNRHWRHGLPARRGVVGPRVNLTFRDIRGSGHLGP
ncbi:DNA oxidative demethylase ALKBH2-like [Anolis carolinensis]|uniref:DNA oxidative demethylase ALKBH2-like n=1 Tax=Anolis carolinensis TaxID=28377 RepID=UPI002F2B6F3F